MLPLHGQPMTIPERVEAFKGAFPNHRSAWPWVAREDGRDVLYAVWVLGASYKAKSRFYGAFPPRFLPYLLALFPDVRLRDVLHAFSGSLKPGPYTRLDINPELAPDLVGSVYDAATLVGLKRFKLALADPPYSADDAKKYGTTSVNQLRATTALAGTLVPGGFVAWLDTSWPIHTKLRLLTVGRIYVQRSTQHRTRVCTLFQRAPRGETRFEYPSAESSRVVDGAPVFTNEGERCVDYAWPWLPAEIRA